MFKSFNILALGLLVFSVFIVFQVGYKVQNLRKDLNEIERQISFEEDSLRVLKAEWSYLSHPDRLRYLASKHLKMKNMKVAQIGTFSNADEAVHEVSFSSNNSVLINPVVPEFKPVNYIIDERKKFQVSSR